MRQLTAKTILLMVALTSAAYAEGPKCHKIFAESVVLSPEEITISIREMAALRLELDSQKAAGLTSVALSALESDYHKKETELVQNLIGNKRLSRDEFILRFKNQLQELQKNFGSGKKEIEKRRKVESEAIKKEIIDGRKLVFQPIEHGSFMMGQGKSAVHVTLTRSFEMAATVTTQLVYKTIAELINTKLNGRLYLNPTPVEKFEDLKPVVSISYDAINLWIKALNELSARGESTLNEIIPDHQKGDIYRLPTEAEWEFVATRRGTIDQSYWESILEQVAWSNSNTKEIMPVVTKAPFTVGSSEFYDLMGNVSQIVQDGMAELPGGVDPMVPPNISVVRRGGQVSSLKLDLNERDVVETHTLSGKNGFRLVREVRL